MKKNSFIIIILLIIIVIQNMQLHKGMENNCLESRYENSLKTVIKNACEIKISTKSEAIGSGVFLKQDKVMTCYHLLKDVIDDKKDFKIFAKFYGTSKWIECSVFKYSKKKDVLILCLKEQIDYLQKVRFAKINEIATGMPVYGIGNSLGNGLSVHRGIIGIAYKKIERDGSVVGTTQTDIAIDNGDSGGPVYNYEGELIGIMSFRMVDSLGNVTFSNSYAISLKEIIEFLDNNHVL